MVFPMLIGQGMQTIDGLLLGMFSKSPIPQSGGVAVATSTTEAE